MVLGSDGGVQHDGALPLPPLRVGQDEAAQVHRRLSRERLRPSGLYTESRNLAFVFFIPVICLISA